MATFVSGFIVGFTAAWQLALVTLAVVPLIAVIGGLSAAALAKFSSKSQDELSKASNIADQVIHFLIHFTTHIIFCLFLRWDFCSNVCYFTLSTFVSGTGAN